LLPPLMRHYAFYAAAGIRRRRFAGRRLHSRCRQPVAAVGWQRRRCRRSDAHAENASDMSFRTPLCCRRFFSRTPCCRQLPLAAPPPPIAARHAAASHMPCHASHCRWSPPTAEPPLMPPRRHTAWFQHATRRRQRRQYAKIMPPRWPPHCRERFPAERNVSQQEREAEVCPPPTSRQQDLRQADEAESRQRQKRESKEVV